MRMLLFHFFFKSYAHPFLFYFWRLFLHCQHDVFEYFILTISIHKVVVSTFSIYLIAFEWELCKHQLSLLVVANICHYYSNDFLLPVFEVYMMGFSWSVVLHDWMLIVFIPYTKYCKVHVWFFWEFWRWKLFLGDN